MTLIRTVFAVLVALVLSSVGTAQIQPAALELPVQVLDAATQKPIKGAKIRVQYDYVLDNLTTDENGRATVAILPGHERRVAVTAFADDHAGRRIVRRVAKANPDLSPLVFELGAGHRLGGRVIDVDGKPVEGAGVSYFGAGGKWTEDGDAAMGTAVTDKDGRWSANVFTGDEQNLHLHVSHARHGTLAFTRTADDALRNQTDVITLHFPLVIQFTVTDGDSGKQITDRKAFRVTYMSTPALDSNHHPVNIGTRKGDFSVWFPAEIEEVALRIEADGYEAVTSPKIVRDKDRKPLQWNVTLQRVKANP